MKPLPNSAEFTNRVCLTLVDLSKALGRSPKALLRMLREGQLPPRRPIGAKRLGWRLRDLLSWLEVARQAEWKELHRPAVLLRERAAEPGKDG